MWQAHAQYRPWFGPLARTISDLRLAIHIRSRGQWTKLVDSLAAVDEFAEPDDMLQRTRALPG